VLESNTYQSLTATIKYNEWKRLWAVKST
jgi:hypothetical protein